MNIAIVGNREGWTYERVKEVLLENDVFNTCTRNTRGNSEFLNFDIKLGRQFDVC